MKSKQLANVLLKILGLSMCLNAIPTFFYQAVLILTPLWSSTVGPSSNIHETLIRQETATALSFGASEVIEIVIGLLLIVKSRKISEYLFKNEDE